MFLARLSRVVCEWFSTYFIDLRNMLIVVYCNTTLLDFGVAVTINRKCIFVFNRNNKPYMSI